MAKVVASTARPISSVPSRAAVMGLAHLHMAHDVLAHHDGVVDQQADAQAQRHHGHEVQREAEGIHGDEAADHRDRQRQPGDDGAAPAEFRNRKTMATVSSAPSISVCRTRHHQLLELPRVAHAALDAQQGVLRAVADSRPTGWSALASRSAVAISAGVTP
jgi:hypothetical protein